MIIIMIILVTIIIGVFVFYQSRNVKENSNVSNTMNNKDAKKFASKYTKISEDNVFVYRTPDEIIDIMKHGTGVTYLGFPECPWCQAYVKYLSEVAKEVGIEKKYYTNTKDMKAKHIDKYDEIVDLLAKCLQYNVEGKPWIYVPNTTFIINGKIIGNDNETSKDTHGLKDPDEYWTEC